MLTLYLALLLVLQLHSSFGQVVTGIDVNPSCKGSLSISHHDTRTELHKINNIAMNIVIRHTRVVVQQTGNCCYHVFNRKNCHGKSVLAKNNEFREIKHSGSLSVVKFDARSAGKEDCSNVSNKYTKDICDELLKNDGEYGKLRIDKDRYREIKGHVYNVTDVKNDTVIDIRDEEIVGEKNEGSGCDVMEKYTFSLVLTFMVLFRVW